MPHRNLIIELEFPLEMLYRDYLSLNGRKYPSTILSSEDVCVDLCTACRTYIAVLSYVIHDLCNAVMLIDTGSVIAIHLCMCML